MDSNGKPTEFNDFDEKYISQCTMHIKNCVLVVGIFYSLAGILGFFVLSIWFSDTTAWIVLTGMSLSIVMFFVGVSIQIGIRREIKMALLPFLMFSPIAILVTIVISVVIFVNRTVYQWIILLRMVLAVGLQCYLTYKVYKGRQYIIDKELYELRHIQLPQSEPIADMPPCPTITIN